MGEGGVRSRFRDLSISRGWADSTYPRDSALQSVIAAKATGLHGEQERTSIAKSGVTKWKSGIDFLQDLELTDVEKVQHRVHRVAAGGNLTSWS